MSSAERLCLSTLMQMSLEEDHAREDITSHLAIPEDARGDFEVRARQYGVVAGLEAIGAAFAELEQPVEIGLVAADGDLCEPGTVLARVAGRHRPILAAERSFLNLVGALSGTATLTRLFVDAVGPGCTILDTRKTLPGYRVLQKYAVRCGGGQNHRGHLADGLLLKDNHRHGGLDLGGLVERARRSHPEVSLVIEVDDLAELDRALALDVDRILLDNFDPAGVAEARRRRDEAGSRIGLEVSGRVDLERAALLARAGAEFLSIGALTHSAPAWDVGLDAVAGQ